MIAPTPLTELAASRSDDLRDSGRTAARSKPARPAGKRGSRRRRLQLRPAFGR